MSNEVTGSGSGGGSALMNQPIVMDVGTSTTKAGFAGGAKPKVVIGTKVGRAKHMRIMPGGALEQEMTSGPTSVFVGSKLDEHRGAFILDYPMDKGHVLDGNWGDMEKIFEHIYSKQNLNAKMDEHPVLLTEPPLNPQTNREQIAEIFFETYRAPAVFFSPPAVLSLYASGRTTGVVLDVGDGLTHCVPIYEGYALPHSITRSDVAGRDVTKRLQLLLRKSGLAFNTTAESDLVKTMKEELCFVSQKNKSIDQGGSKANAGDDKESEKVMYQLPDGQAVNVSNERHMAPEILFKPSLIGSEEMGVADTLIKSIMKSDLDLRPTLFTQIVLAGGSTCTSGFGDRLLSEVREKAPTHTRIRISAPPERIYSAWAGGSILASLSTFKNMWVTRSDYEEYGSNLLHRSGL
jgi:centractin